MKLFEHEAKKLLKELGIPVPQGYVASSADQAVEAARQIGKPVVLKSQMLVAGRGKAGGIKFADDTADVKEIAAGLLGQIIKGCLVNTLLVEEKLSIAEQFYASVTVDRLARKYAVLASTSGGVDIEEIARTSPDKIVRHRIDPEAGLTGSDTVGLMARLGLTKSDAEKFAAVTNTLYRAAMDYDAELIELNPLVKTSSGEFVAADARIIVDDNAIFRHPEFQERSLARPDDTPLEAEARKQKLSYVDLDGDIGIAGNGAGLMMATIDLVQTAGGQPGDFLDIGGAGNIKKGITLLISKPEIRVVFINVFGGITRCDVVAEGIVQVLKETSTQKPVVVRLMGTNDEEGTRILKQAGITAHRDLEESVATAVKIAAEVAKN